MKHTLLSLSLVLSTFFGARAQLEVSPNPHIASYELDLSSPGFVEAVAYGDLSNTSNNTILMRWEINVIDAPAAWKFAVCDGNQCYADFVTTNWDPTNFIELPDTLTAGETGSTLDLHVRPNQTAGTAEIEIYLSSIDDPSTVIATAIYEITISDVSSVSQVAVQNLRIFPNPSTDYFALSSSQGIQRIELYNIVGRQVRSYEVVEGRKYYIANLPDGMYLAGLIGNNGEVLRTMRISKRGMRP